MHRPATNSPKKPAAVVVYMDPWDINETPENWELYKKPAADDPAYIRLRASVRKKGVNTPLEVSRDHYTISGHRRLLAARAANVRKIPVIVNYGIEIEPMSPGDRRELLASRNDGIRVKTDAELYLEAQTSVDPNAAVRAAEARKAQLLDKSKSSRCDVVNSQGDIRRNDPSKARNAMLQAVLKVLDELRAKNMLPVSARHLHYRLLPLKVLTSNSKAGYIYGTRKGSAKLLSVLMTDARSEGIINPNDISDETRSTLEFEHDGNVPTYLANQLDHMFQNYFSNIHADQLNHVEILVEKNTIAPLIWKHVGSKLRLPVSSMHGYGSQPVARDVAARYKASGKTSLIVVYVSDLDPEGMDMPAAFKKYLLHDFRVHAKVVRAAVTMEQVKRFSLPPDADVKLTSSRAKGFIEKYGRQCWELDSVPVETLVDEVSNVVKSFLDIDALNRAFANEKQDDVKLAKMAAAVRAFITDQFKSELVAN